MHTRFLELSQLINLKPCLSTEQLLRPLPSYAPFSFVLLRAWPMPWRFIWVIPYGRLSLGKTGFCSKIGLNWILVPAFLASASKLNQSLQISVSLFLNVISVRWDSRSRKVSQCATYWLFDNYSWLAVIRLDSLRVSYFSLYLQRLKPCQALDRKVLG